MRLVVSSKGGRGALGTPPARRLQLGGEEVHNLPSTSLSSSVYFSNVYKSMYVTCTLPRNCAMRLRPREAPTLGGARKSARLGPTRNGRGRRWLRICTRHGASHAPQSAQAGHTTAAGGAEHR